MPRLVSFRGHKELEPRPDGLLWGLNSKFLTSIPVCFIWECPPPQGGGTLCLAQCAKKDLMSDSPGLLDFAIRLMNSVFDGQVMFFEQFE